MQLKIKKPVYIIGALIICFLLLLVSTIVFFLKGSSAAFTLEECKRVISEANKVLDEVVLQKTGAELGKIDNMSIMELKGNYSTFSALSGRIIKYYANKEALHIDLQKRGVFVVGDRLGIIKVRDIVPFLTNENTVYNIGLDEGNRKEIVLESVIGGNKVSGGYTLEKTGKKNGIKILDVGVDNPYNLYFMVSKVEASSSDNSFLPEEAVDLNRDTPWMEASGGQDGREKWIKFYFEKPVSLNSVDISNGYAKTRQLHSKYSRAKDVVVELSDGTKLERKLADLTIFTQPISFDKSIRTDYVKISIKDVYKGSVDQVCISEVVLKGSMGK